MSNSATHPFRIAFSADFCDEQGRPVFPDIGLPLLDKVPRISHEFLRGYQPEYPPGQLADYDVVISLKPKVTARISARGFPALCYRPLRRGLRQRRSGCLHRAWNRCVHHPCRCGAPVAESIVLFVLALSHNLMFKDRQVRRGLWAESTRRLGREPRQRVVGTIGMGNIATEAIRLLRSFDVGRFLAFDPYISAERATQLGVELVSLEELLHASDYVLVNCPLTPQTRGLIGKPQFALMKTDAVLINTARGPIVDEEALTDALQDSKIGGAALDVFEQ